MEINGINLDGLAHDATKIEFPDEVPGRVVHIDADFLAYQCSYEREPGTTSLSEMQGKADVAVRTLRALAGAEKAILHLTPHESNKGNRHAIAIQKEYQGNRKDKPKPLYLHAMRDYLGSNFDSMLGITHEADDGMSSEQYKALADGRENLSVIATKDKDLNMVPGLHLHWDTGRIIHADWFGEVHLRARGSGAKVLDGYGQKFFWAQLLAGDSADNIQGLPKYTDPKVGKVKLCGPVLTASLLEGCSTHRECLELIVQQYKAYGEHTGFKHWETGADVPWQQVLFSEAQLLWMRRVPHDDIDVKRFFKEIKDNG